MFMVPSHEGHSLLPPREKKNIEDVSARSIGSKELTLYFIGGSGIYLMESSGIALRDLLLKKYSIGKFKII